LQAFILFGTARGKTELYIRAAGYFVYVSFYVEKQVLSLKLLIFFLFSLSKAQYSSRQGFSQGRSEASVYIALTGS
jgi:hypothetical protein